MSEYFGLQKLWITRVILERLKFLLHLLTDSYAVQHVLKQVLSSSFMK